jgi:uncharacterized protein
MTGTVARMSDRRGVRALLEPTSAVPLILIGVAAGVLSGLLGVGGGIVMVPAMAMLAGIGQQRAQATSLAAIVPIAIVGALVFGGAAQVDLVAAALLIAGSLAGVRVGTGVMHRLSDARLTLIFATFMAAVALLMLLT